MVRWLGRRTFCGSRPIGLFIAVLFPSDRKFFSALSLFTQVYKWVLPTSVLLGVTLQWTNIPSRKGGGGGG